MGLINSQLTDYKSHIITHHKSIPLLHISLRLRPYLAQVLCDWQARGSLVPKMMAVFRTALPLIQSHRANLRLEMVSPSFSACVPARGQGFLPGLGFTRRAVAWWDALGAKNITVKLAEGRSCAGAGLVLFRFLFHMS